MSTPLSSTALREVGKLRYIISQWEGEDDYQPSASFYDYIKQKKKGKTKKGKNKKNEQVKCRSHKKNFSEKKFSILKYFFKAIVFFFYNNMASKNNILCENS